MPYRYFSLFIKTHLLHLILNSNHHMKTNIKEQVSGLVIENWNLFSYWRLVIIKLFSVFVQD